MTVLIHSGLISFLLVAIYLLLIPIGGARSAQAAVMLAPAQSMVATSNPSRSETYPDTQAAIQVWQQRIQRSPRSYLSYLQLGQAYLRRARETGDVSYYVKAEAAVRQAADINPRYPNIQPLLAQILYSLHEFKEALAIAQSLEDSGSQRALATLGDVYQALGRYQEAETTYQTLAQMKESASLYSRQAALKEATGDFDQALHLMEKATASAYSEGYYGESLAWHEFQLGELYWKAARFTASETHFKKALAIYPDYYLALAGLGRIAAARGQSNLAIDYLTQATDQIPQPDLLATLGDLFAIRGQEEQAEKYYSTVEFIGHLAKINQQVYNRQLVMFYADHDRNVDQAVTLAERELQDRQDLLGWDAAAWAYFKHGQLDLAQAAMEHALELHPHNAMIYYHAGLIARDHGQSQLAQQQLAHALDLHPAFDPLQAPRAQQALKALQSEEEAES
ncbi:MAG: tetratricopeptide repeat protein [Synechococcaceae cyanobacterium SM2_3_1]|nr:tetratricopeptide repeat protein [Synechococcaceae cyanobacterium SM2_3_1]